MGGCCSLVAERVNDTAQVPGSGDLKTFHIKKNSKNSYLQSPRTAATSAALMSSSSNKLSFFSALDSFADQGSHHLHSKVNRFDVFSAHRLCEETLAAVGYLALRDVAEKLSLPLETLATFCEAVDKHMLADGYHSRLHVADVLQLMVLQTLGDGESCYNNWIETSLLALMSELHPVIVHNDRWKQHATEWRTDLLKSSTHGTSSWSLRTYNRICRKNKSCCLQRMTNPPCCAYRTPERRLRGSHYSSVCASGSICARPPAPRCHQRFLASHKPRAVSEVRPEFNGRTNALRLFFGTDR